MSQGGGLETALLRAGFEVRVEVRDGLLVLIPRGDRPDLTSEAPRRAAVTLAAEHGFTHVALELVD